MNEVWLPFSLSQDRSHLDATLSPCFQVKDIILSSVSSFRQILAPGSAAGLLPFASGARVNAGAAVGEVISRMKAQGQVSARPFSCTLGAPPFAWRADLVNPGHPPNATMPAMPADHLCLSGLFQPIG
jgi:hypothetical protein